jgi:hypothetical protein
MGLDRWGLRTHADSHQPLAPHLLLPADTNQTGGLALPQGAEQGGHLRGEKKAFSTGVDEGFKRAVPAIGR